MPLVNIKLRQKDNSILEGVVWLLEDQDDLVDDNGKIYGKVGDLYRGHGVIVQTPEGMFTLNPKSIISIEHINVDDLEDQ